MRRSPIVLLYPLIPSCHLFPAEHQPVPLEANRGCGRTCRTNIDELQSVVLSKKMKALAIDKLRLTEDRVTTNVFMARKLLMNPNESRPDQRACSDKIGILGEMDHQRSVALHLNRPGFVGGSNFQIGWSRYEQDDEQILS